jgi:hypothetical protein
MSNRVKHWDYWYQETKEEASEERHICGEPQCWVWTSMSQWYDLFHLHPHYLKYDAVYWHLPAQRITRRRQPWSSNVSGIWVGRQCTLPTSEQGIIYSYSLYTTLQVNILVLDTYGFSNILPTTSMNVVCTKHTSEEGSVCRRMVYQADSGYRMQSGTWAQNPLGFQWLTFISRVKNASLSAC